VPVVTGEIIEPETAEVTAPTGRTYSRNQRITLRETRGYARGVEGILVLFRPDLVVPAAQPVIRELAVKVAEWAASWITSEEAAS
jgi:hypothetical protein